MQEFITWGLPSIVMLTMIYALGYYTIGSIIKAYGFKPARVDYWMNRIWAVLLVVTIAMLVAVSVMHDDKNKQVYNVETISG